MINSSHVKKILIIKLRGIGDVVLSSVVFDNLRDNFPAASVDYITEKPSEQVLEPLPFINKVILFSRKELKDRISLIMKVRKEKYDLILDFYSNPFTAQITFLSGAKYRAGFPYKGRKYAYNIYGPAERAKYHAAELHLKFLEEIGMKVTSGNLQLGITETDKNFAEEYFKNNFNDGKLVIGISPSGGWESKKCDPIKFAEIADAIADKYNARLLLLWGPGDEADADEIIKLMKHDITKAPATKIGAMAALISQCSALVANDSGPMHISTAVNTPTLSIHGPTDPKLQGPYGSKHEYVLLDELECIICNLLECPRNHECFLELPAERVISVFNTLLKKNNLLQS